MTPMQKVLLGTWRSDKRRTLQSIHKYHCLTGAKKRIFSGLFGKLELRYSQKYVHVRLRGFEYRERYEVLAEDTDSIVIRLHSDELKMKIDSLPLKVCEDFFKPRLQHITFRPQRGHPYYWIGLGLGCEWFRKVIE